MIALISDVHGNLPALQAVLAEVDALGCGEVVSLGDLAGYYCLLNGCIDLLRERGAVNLLGNHDHYLLSGAPCTRSKAVNRCLEVQAATLTQDRRRWLEGSPRTQVRDGLSLVHGGWNDPIEEYLYTLRDADFRDRDGRLFCSGHTHVQALHQVGAKRYCNPGSVGQPRDGDPRAAFAVVDGDQVLLRRVAYDVDRTIHAMRQAGFDPYFYEHLRLGTALDGSVRRVAVE